jgi:hypothetical protein
MLSPNADDCLIDAEKIQPRAKRKSMSEFA